MEREGREKREGRREVKTFQEGEFLGEESGEEALVGEVEGEV